MNKVFKNVVYTIDWKHGILNTEYEILNIKQYQSTNDQNSGKSFLVFEFGGLNLS